MINSAQDIALSFSDMVSSKGLSLLIALCHLINIFTYNKEKNLKNDLTINIFNDELKKEASFRLDILNMNSFQLNIYLIKLFCLLVIMSKCILIWFTLY